MSREAHVRFWEIAGRCNSPAPLTFDPEEIVSVWTRSRGDAGRAGFAIGHAAELGKGYLFDLADALLLRPRRSPTCS